MLFPQWEDSLFSNINSEQAPADKEEEDECSSNLSSNEV